jgi:hypothetical protein
MKDLNIKPSLRISHIVYGRLGSDNRVKYLVDANGKGEKMAIPETVVLTRWRKRKFPGYIFSGARLSSTLWRAVGKAFGVDAKAICKLSVEEIAQITESERSGLMGSGYLKLPNPDVLHAIFVNCTTNRLQKILDRHLSEEHRGKSGIPDLFLFAISSTNQKLVMGRFVEVKKPEEPLSKVQKEELVFLNDIGLNARVLRLVERGPRNKIDKSSQKSA